MNSSAQIHGISPRNMKTPATPRVSKTDETIIPFRSDATIKHGVVGNSTEKISHGIIPRARGSSANDTKQRRERGNGN